MHNFLLLLALVVCFLGIVRYVLPKMDIKT